MQYTDKSLELLLFLQVWIVFYQVLVIIVRSAFGEG